MVMMTSEAIDRLLDAGPDLESVAYRNAWGTVKSRLKVASKPETVANLMALQARLEALGPPRKHRKTGHLDALARGRETLRNRAVGRCRASLLRKLATSRYRTAVVSDDKPFLWEAALQLIEDGEAGFQRAQGAGNQGPAPADGRPKKVRMWIYCAEWIDGRECPYVSKRKQDEENRI